VEVLLVGEISEAELNMFAIGQTYEPMEETKNYTHYYKKTKGKVTPLQARCGPEGV
jgi:hypothetical protein